MTKREALERAQVAIDRLTADELIAAEADAAFDGGEWSSSFHFADEFERKVDAVLARYGLTEAEWLEYENDRELADRKEAI